MLKFRSRSRYMSMYRFIPSSMSRHKRRDSSTHKTKHIHMLKPISISKFMPGSMPRYMSRSWYMSRFKSRHM